MMDKFIGYGKQFIDDEDIKSVVDVLKSDFLTQGPKVKEFESAICNYTGAKYCIAVSNGTAALHIAIAALNIPQGKSGITSPNTFMATSNAMVFNKITPDFADIKSDTYCIDPKNIKSRITNTTSLLVPVHFSGQVCDMQEIYNASKESNLYIIEDAAHAIGSKYEDGEIVGNCKYSDMTIFSFHPVKTITTGEGGAITTNNEQLYKSLKELRSHGITKSEYKLEFSNRIENNGQWYHEMQSLGFNYRLTDIQAALGITQLKKLDRFIEKRRGIVNKYNHAFRDIDWLTTPYEKEGAESAFHLYVLLFDFDKIGKTKQEVVEKLRMQNIGTQVHYIPVHTQPYYRKHFGFSEGDFPIAEKYYKQTLSIPLYPMMTDVEVNHVIESVLNLAYNK